MLYQINNNLEKNCLDSTSTKFQRLHKASIEVRLNNNYSYTQNNWDLDKRYTKKIPPQTAYPSVLLTRELQA